MDVEVLKEYAEVKKQMASLEEREKVLKVAVLEEMERAAIDKAETEFGKFSKATRKNYSYSAKVDELEEKVKLAKLREVEKGIAKAQETSYVIYKAL